MSRIPWLKKIVSVAVIGGLLLGSAGIVYAADSDSVANTTHKVKSKINSMMMGGRGHGAGMIGQEMGLGMNLDLDALVQDGVITSDEANAIQNKIDALNDQRQAEMEKVKAMTAEERAAYLRDNRLVRNDCLADLVTAGTITQTQADAVYNVIGDPHGKSQGKATGANYKNCPNNNGDKSSVTPSQDSNAEGKEDGRKGHGGMGHAKGHDMGIK